MNNVINPLAKSVLIRLGLRAAVSAADAGIQKKNLRGSGHRPLSSASHSNNNSNDNNDNNKILIISNNEMKNIIEIVKSLEDSSLLPERVSKTVQNEAKKQKGEFFSMLLGTLGVILLGNILAGKGINRAGQGIVRTGYGSKKVEKQQ